MSEQNPEQEEPDSAPSETGDPGDLQEGSDSSEGPEAPVAAESPGVYVAPNPTPTQHNLLGKDYEVTPEKGYRQVKQEPPSDEGSNDSES